jgi:hypothetical protein
MIGPSDTSSRNLILVTSVRRSELTPSSSQYFQPSRSRGHTLQLKPAMECGLVDTSFHELPSRAVSCPTLRSVCE